MERHFSEQQVSDIIRKAAERQSRSDTPGAVPHGISETELRRVAKELGIDQEALQHAISEVGAHSLSDSGTLKSLDRTLERTIDGDIPEEALALVVEEFVPVAGLQGTTLSIGRSLNYTSMVRMGQCNINVGPRNGKTVLRVKSNAFLAALPTFIPAVVGTVLSTGLVWGEMFAPTGTKVLVYTLLMSGVWGGAAFAFRSMVRETNRRVLELTERSAAKLGEAAAHLRQRLTGSGPPVFEEPESRLSADR